MSTNRSFRRCLVLLLVMVVVPADAQDYDFALSDCEGDSYTEPNCAGVTAPYTDPEHDGAPMRNEVQITVDDDGERALLTLGGKVGGTVDWKVTVSSPLDKKSGTTQLATLDGLGNDAKVAFEVSGQIGGTPPPRRAATCGPAIAAALRTEPAYLTADARGELPVTASGEYCSLDKAQEVAPYNVAVQRQLAVSAYAAQSRPGVLRFGAKAGFGYDDFEYLDADFAPAGAREKAYSLGAHLSYTNVVRGWSIVGSVARQSAFRNVDASLAEICVPIGDTEALRCFEGYTAPPVRAESTVGAVEGRWLARSGRSAVSVRLSRDATHDVTGVSVPIYLLVNKDKKLAGGIKLGWRSDTDEPQIGIFVSSAFTL